MKYIAGWAPALLCAPLLMTLITAPAEAAPDVFGLGRIHLEGPPVAPPIAPPITFEEKTDIEPRLRDFGFALVEADRRTIRELAPFSSLVVIAWDHPELTELAAYSRTYGVKLLISVYGLFFSPEDAPGVPLPPWSLRPDYAQRWEGFIQRNLEVLGPGTVWGFYLADEPFLNQIPLTALVEANRAVKETFPLIPTVTSLCSLDVDAAPWDLPEDLFDIVGYHAYAVPEDPNTDPEYQYYIHLMLEKFARRDYMVVADAWWSEQYHGRAGFDLQTLIERAGQFRRVAEDIGAVALGAFLWQSIPGGTGLRELPEEAVREYIDIGSEISGRCGVPAAVRPLAGETALFLQDCRFYVTARWRDPATGEEGTAVARPLTSDTGMFWFFEPSNIELTVKLLDGTTFNGHWWVFWSQMTTLEVSLEVTDTETGKVVTYTDPATDTAAFADL